MTLKFKTKNYNICVFFFFLNLIAAVINMAYYADIIAKYAGGYFVAVGVVPFTVGCITGIIGILMRGQGLIMGFKNNWGILVASELGEFLPISCVLWGMAHDHY